VAAWAAAGVAVHPVAPARALETWRASVHGDGAAPAVLVLGAGVGNRLTLARALHQRAPGAHLVFLVEPDGADAFRQAMTRTPMIGAHWTVAAGGPQALAVELGSVVGSTRQRLGFRASLDRINAQRRAGSEPEGVPRGLIVTNHYLASILEHAEDAILAIERDDTIATWNVGAAALFLIEAGAALGRSVGLLADPADASTLLALVHGAREGTTARNRELTCRRSDGTTFRASLTIAPVRDEAGRTQSVSLMLRDVTARRRHEAEIEALNAELAERLREVHRANAELASTLAALERTQRDLLDVNRTLERQATTDALTGLKNRIVFQNSLLEMIHLAERQRIPLSVLLVDVDHFKRVNDTWGHQQGDRALQAVARALMDHVREQDIVARFGGEEFAVLLPHTDLEAALLVAEHLRSGCAGVFDLQPTLTVSIGVAAYEPGEAEAALIRRADAALYASKAQGRDRVTAAERSVREPAAGRSERA
jgi:diguanylate cyclase (GGDEF)-like protein/PAS domain S-box-containing protein